jgi:hypothetical protein
MRIGSSSLLRRFRRGYVGGREVLELDVLLKFHPIIAVTKPPQNNPLRSPFWIDVM